MQPVALVALGIVTIASVVLWFLGQKYTRRHVALHGAMPRLTWMFHRVEDEELERSRRQAIGLLPVYLIALALYLSQG